MSMILDAIHAAADPEVVIGALLAITAVVTVVQWRRAIVAEAYLDGYQYGHQDGRAGKIAGVRWED